MDVPGGATRPRDMSAAQAHAFAARVREFLITHVCATGGHLGPNLGVVELTIALHRVFDSPTDTLLFDTGHQAYTHKILTGRAEEFGHLRQAGGLSGYPSRRESPHDHIENSHASTALAYADGIAKGRTLRGETERAVVAVIGDGALTGGMAWEALNNIAAAPGRPVIIVLNDNGRSYAPTIGGLADHLAALGVGSASGNVFTDLGLAYLGPVDGHDITACEDALRAARDLRRPVVVHFRTEKGRGYAPALADDAELMHSVGVIDPATGTAAPGAPTWTDVFAGELCELGETREDIVAITAAMPGPTGTAPFGARFPGRFFDVGIAEQHAVTSAAGLAMAGMHPVVAVYATFLGRAFDQVLMDVALHRLPVTFVLDRAGITGPDGPSHHGMWDPALLACVPGLRLAAPRDATRLRELLREAVAVDDGPTALRFPKATAGTDVPAVARLGDLDVLHRGQRMPLDVLIVSYGALAQTCLAAAAILESRGVGVTVVDPRWALPVDPALVALTARHRYAATVTDATRAGGPGSALVRACADAGVSTPVRDLGLPHGFVDHGPRADLLTRAGLSPEAIAQRVLSDLGTGVEARRSSEVPA